MKHFLQYFFQGLLYVVPIAATIWLLSKLVAVTDGLVDRIDYFNVINFPFRGLLFLTVFITLVGYFVPRLVSKSLISLIHQTISRIPLINVVYSSVRDLMEAFVGDKKRFTAPVIVKLDKHGVQHRIGFVTANSLALLGIKDTYESESGESETMVAVYFPASYGVFGDLIVVPKANVKPINHNAADVMKFIVSGGIINLNADSQA